MEEKDGTLELKEEADRILEQKDKNKEGNKENKKELFWFFFWLIALTAVAEGVSIAAFYREDLAMTQAGMMALMYVPLVSVLLSRRSLRGIGFRLRFRGNVRYYLLAWFSPVVFSLLGAALYFGLFPGHFDTSGAILGETLLANLKEQGISYSTYVVVSLISCLTYAPLTNLFLALGEEAGWRGYLYPVLKKTFGEEKGWLLGGLIWGLWHSPLIVFTGYEYGAKVPGFPISGVLLFCVFCIACGVLLDLLYVKTGSIWAPCIFHGSINAAGTLGLALLAPGHDAYRLLGPGPQGLVAGLPILFVTAFLARKWVRKARPETMD